LPAQGLAAQLAWATRTINEALEESDHFWAQAITWDRWEELRSSLSGEPGFHGAYNATREAWDALQRAEVDRLNYDPESDVRGGELAPWVRRHIETALTKADEAEGLLFNYLANYDSY